MIHEVDEALRVLLAGLLAGDEIEVVLDTPTRDWAARRNAPTINAFLYDVRENIGLRHQGGRREYGTRGEILARHEPPRWYGLSYLVTAWTKRSQDEHRLLSVLLAGLSRKSAIGAHRLSGSLAEFGAALPYTVAHPPADGRRPGDLWSALGSQLKPSLDLVVTAPLTAAHHPVTAQVTDALVLGLTDTGRPDGPAPAPPVLRRLRYDREPDGPVRPATPIGSRRTRSRGEGSVR
ncbi:DUF4255 domain-containing protein [Kitasatospora sp. NPDC088346]|uniref:DUF4255 domain-containing protein n=1 Tax=Kitasatospora sp. NPDC088346 TaxID=3364073 RepID=UPI0038253F82